MIIFEDDGPGIPEDQYKNVFKPFFRLDKSRSLNQSGVGLGLAIVEDVINSHGGNIQLSKSKYDGLQVKISLPLGLLFFCKFLIIKSCFWTIFFKISNSSLETRLSFLTILSFLNSSSVDISFLISLEDKIPFSISSDIVFKIFSRIFHNLSYLIGMLISNVI